jgi:hypothetical protein
MSEAAQITQISDNVNQGYIAGRDLYLGDQYVVQETLFFEPDLTTAAPPAWPTTAKARELARSLATHRLVVLAGQDVDDKTLVARHLAWLLRQELPGEVRVREWYRSSDPQKIETSFHETDTTILLLPQIQPHHIGHRLTELTRLLQVRRQYAVITTDGSRADWGIRSSSSEECLWHEMSWETWYGRSFLAEALLTELASLNGQLPDWLPRDLHSEAMLAEDLTLEDVAARLKQPERIQRFAEWITTDEASPRTMMAQLDQLGGARAAIFHWYRQLDRADQLLALGLVLFDGLPDDQIFAALELLVNEAWRQSDPNLPLFDYRDLQRLSSYFHLIESGEDGTRIETSSRLKRETILQAAWEFQRRRLLAVVPTITRLLQEPDTRGTETSAEPTARNKALNPWMGRLSRKAEPAPQEDPELWRFTRGIQRELFSSPRRVEQLQRSIIEALSQIGVLSFEAVEASFLELAVARTAEAQTIVAKALAAWRGEGHSEQLFRVLKAWWADGCIASSAKSLVEKTIRAGEDPRAAMRATVALTVGYALQYDRPNQLDPELLGLLRMLVQDRHPAVHARMLELTLPLAVASHLRQLEPLLRHQITVGQEYLYATAFGTAMAFSLRPAESIEVIERWHAFCRAQASEEQTDLAITPRDRLLAVVAMAYGYIRCDQTYGLLTPDQIVSGLRSILATETNPFVRAHALMAMGLQAVESFELVSSSLMELVSEITLADRLHVVTVLARAYLRQREQMDGGDEQIEIGGRKYQVWLDSPRPLTAIETALYTWLRDEHHPVAQQVAIQTFAAIAATELDRQERTLPFRRPPALPAAPPSIVRLSPDLPRLRTAGFLGRAAVILATPRRKETRALLHPIMAEVIEVQRLEPTRFFEAVTAHVEQGNSAQPGQATPHRNLLLPMLLARWQATGQEGLQGLVRTLGIALDLFRWRWAILLTLAVSCGLLVHDVRDWKRAFSSSLPLEEQRTLQQRLAAPLRLAQTLSLPGNNLLNELQWQGDEELGLSPLRPADRLVLSAERALRRLRNEELAAVAVQDNAEEPESIQAAVHREPSQSGAPRIEEAAPSPSDRMASSPEEDRSTIATVRLGSQDVPVNFVIDSLSKRGKPPSEALDQEQPTAKPGIWKKLKGRFSKKKPPQGEDHGHR